MTDITTFEGRNTFGKPGRLNEVFTLPKIIEYSKDRFENNPDEPNFMKGYLPEMQYPDTKSIKDVFLKTIGKTFEIDGAQCVRFILLNSKGDIYEDLDQWTQVLPNSFLARITCSYRNFDPSSLVLDYFIDMNEIQLNNESSFGMNTISFIDKEISAGYVTKDNRKIKIDDRISDFNNHKKEVFIDFFKYDFGSAIKTISKE